MKSCYQELITELRSRATDPELPGGVVTISAADLSRTALELERIGAELNLVCQECDTALEEVEASDDPDVATVHQVVRVTIDFHKDEAEQAEEELSRARGLLKDVLGLTLTSAQDGADSATVALTPNILSRLRKAVGTPNGNP